MNVVDLIDTLLSIYSTSLTSSHLVSAISQLQQYLDRFQNRLKSTHSLNIRQTLSVLHGLVKVCENVIMGAKANPKAKPDMLSTNTLMARIGGGSDQVNLIEMVRYLKESKLARKVSGYTEHAEEVSAKKGRSNLTDRRNAGSWLTLLQMPKEPKAPPRDTPR